MVMTKKGKVNVRRKKGSVDGKKGCIPKMNKERVFERSSKADGKLEWLRADGESRLCSTFTSLVRWLQKL